MLETFCGTPVFRITVQRLRTQNHQSAQSVTSGKKFDRGLHLLSLFLVQTLITSLIIRQASLNTVRKFVPKP